jgi:hypothetical protein
MADAPKPTPAVLPKSSDNVALNTFRASGMPEVSNKGENLAVTTTNINVFANGQRVGFIQSLTPSESRTINKIQELGTEGVVQSVPSNTNGGQLAVTRFAVYNGGLYNALGLTRNGYFVGVGNQTATGNDITKDAATGTFSNPFKTLKDQRVPIEIEVTTAMPTGKFYYETYVDCWLSSYSKTIAANTITITESATIQYSDVYAQMA